MPNNRSVLVALACLALPVLAAHGAELKLPSFAHLKKNAVEAVDLTLDAAPLALAIGMMDDGDPKSAEIKKALEGLEAVRVLNYQFDTDFAYSKADLDAVRSQLSKPGWSPLVQVRDRKQNEDVDIFLALDNDKATGLAIVVSEPREFTVVSIVGSIDLKQIAKLQKQFHLPAAAVERISQHAP